MPARAATTAPSPTPHEHPQRKPPSRTKPFATEGQRSQRRRRLRAGGPAGRHPHRLDVRDGPVLQPKVGVANAASRRHFPHARQYLNITDVCHPLWVDIISVGYSCQPASYVT